MKTQTLIFFIGKLPDEDTAQALQTQVLNELKELRKETMAVNTKLQQFSDQLNAFLDKQSKAIDDISQELTTLGNEVTQLQNSANTLDSDDQAVLDSIQNRVSGLTDKLTALDTLQPPATPPQIPPPSNPPASGATS